MPQAELDRIAEYFAAPEFELVNTTQLDIAREKTLDPAYGEWLERNLHTHRAPGYASARPFSRPWPGIWIWPHVSPVASSLLPL